MGNCLRSRRRHELLLQSCDGDDVTVGQGEPLVQRRVVWTADMPLTMGQLQGRRDTFWDTAPMYDGRREIWDALQAAVEAAEGEDYDLAQAILSGANITLPRGYLGEAYDELGNRYVIPRYCLSKPTNLAEAVAGNEDENMATAVVKPSAQASPILRQRGAHTVAESAIKEGGDRVVPKPPPSITVKVRLNTLPKDVRVSIYTTDRIRDLKIKLYELHKVEPPKITMLYSGRVLSNNTLIANLKIPRGHVIQAIVT